MPILSRNLAARVPQQSNEKDWAGTPVETIRVAKQSAIAPHTHMCVPFSSTTTGRLLLELTLLSLNYSILHVVPEVIQPTKTQVFGVYLQPFKQTSAITKTHGAGIWQNTDSVYCQPGRCRKFFKCKLDKY